MIVWSPNLKSVQSFVVCLYRKNARTMKTVVVTLVYAKKAKFVLKMVVNGDVRYVK